MLTAILIVLLVVVVALLATSARIVPQKEAWIVERLGRYSQTLTAGFHVMVPLLDRVAYKRNLKEMALDVPPQSCVTKDNITVTVDGILYLQVVDPVKGGATKIGRRIGENGKLVRYAKKSGEEIK